MNRGKIFWVLLFFFACCLFFFRLYFFGSLVPLPANLLVSFYSPWKFQRWEGFGHGVPNKPIGTDIIKLFYPYRTYTTEALKNFRIPLWNPYVFSGNVHLATYQSAVFYPFNVLYFLFSQMDAWSILVMLQPILAGSGMYLFLRGISLSFRSSLFGAISFAFSGFMIAWWEESLVIEHSIIWLPYALYGSTLIWQEQGKRGYVLLTIAIAMSVLAGFLQMSIYLLGTVALWNMFLYVSSKSSQKNKQLIWVAVAVGTAAMITGVHWIPAFEAYLLSPRGTVKATFLFEQFLVPIRHLITLVAPDFWGNPGSYNYFFPRISYHEKVIYMGIIPLVFLLHALWYVKGNVVRFWKIYTMITLSLGFAIPTSWIWHTLHVPILSVAQPTRIFVLFAFGASLLAAYGFDAYEKNTHRFKYQAPLMLVTLAIGILWSYVGVITLFANNKDVMYTTFCTGATRFPQYCTDLFSRDFFDYVTRVTTTSLRNIVLPTATIVFLWFSFIYLRKKERLFPIVIVIGTLVSALYFSDKFLYFSFRQFVFPETPVITKLKELTQNTERIWGYGNATLEKNMMSYYGLYSAEGYDALYPREYGELLFSIATDGRITPQFPRTDADLKPASQEEGMTTNVYRMRIMSLLGVTYILEHISDTTTTEEVLRRFPRENFEVAWENEQFRIWRYKQALPRTFMASRVQVVPDKQEMANLLFSQDFNGTQTILVEHPIPGFDSSQAKGVSGEASIVTYKPEEITISVQAMENAVLFLSDTYYPGWKAFVDAGEVPIYRANYAFRAVVVPPGDHIVRFVYQPSSFRWGSIVSIAGITLFVGLAIRWHFKRRNITYL